MAFANTPVELYKWVVKTSRMYTLYAGGSQEDARVRTEAILSNPKTYIKEFYVYHCGRKIFQFNRNPETGGWKAKEL